MLFIETLDTDNVPASAISGIKVNHSQGFELSNGHLVRVHKGPDRCYFTQWDSVKDYQDKAPTKQWMAKLS